jgi:hypothetical protein
MGARARQFEKHSVIAVVSVKAAYFRQSQAVPIEANYFVEALCVAGQAYLHQLESTSPVAITQPMARPGLEPSG